MNRWLGIGLITISAASFGTLAIIGRYAYAAGLDVITLLFLRFGFSAAFMLTFLALRKETLPERHTLLQLAGMGGLGYVGQSFCYMSAIQYASAGLVALLLYLYPTFVTILSVIFLKSKLTRWRISALALATIGAALTANPQGGQWQGILLAILAAAIYAVYIIIGTRVMQKVTALQSSTVIFSSAAIVFGGLTFFNGPNWPVSSAGWLAVAAIAVLSTIIPVISFLAGLKIIGPTDASLLSVLEPVVTVGLAAVLFNENIQPAMLLGGGLILVAVLLLTLAGRNPAALSEKLIEGR